MKWLTNNFSLNMIQEKGNYILNIEPMTELAFKIESKTARNRLSQLDISQEVDLFPQPGSVSASVGDIILVVQYCGGELTYRKVTVGDKK